MARILIVGYGNPLRGDDGVGFHAAVRLAAGFAGGEVEVRAVHQLTPELADDLSRAELAIFIDAAAEGEPGAVLLRRLSPEGGAQAFTHQATPPALLSASRALFGSAPEAVLFSIPVESAGFGESMTPPVARALDRVCVQVRAMVSERIAPGTPEI